MRLIDADAFKEYECHHCDGYCDICECNCLNCKNEHRCSFMQDLDDAPTIELLYDYPIKKLVAFAKMCEDAGVTNEDLKTLCNNFMFAHDAFHRDMQRQINAMIEQFCTDKLDVEPIALKGEDDGTP